MIKINQTKGEIIVEDKSYNFSDIVNYLTNTTHQVIADILKENKIKLLRKVRMDAMRATLRPSIVKTRSECLTLDQKLNYRLLWFNDFSEEQMSFYFEYFKSKDLNRLYANKFYRNLLIYLSNFPCHEKCLKDIIDVALESKDLLEKEIKIKEILKVYDEFFLDSKNTIDGLTIDKFRPVIYNSATKKQIERIGLKYGVNIPEKINKQTICAYVVEKLKAMGVNTDDLTSKITKMQVKDIRQYALDNGLETGSELNKKEMIEYILQRAEPTRDGYTCPESDRVYEMRIPITDEESVYEKIIIEQTRLQDELAKKDLMLNKTHGDEHEKLKEEFVKKEEEFAKNQKELLKLQSNYEEELDKEIKEIDSAEREFVKNSETTNLKSINRTGINTHINNSSSLKSKTTNTSNEFDYYKDKKPEDNNQAIDDYYGENLLDEESIEKDALLYDPQKQDLLIWQTLKRQEIHRRGILTLIITVILAAVIIALGSVLYTQLTEERPLNSENFDLKNKTDEALEPLSDKTLTASPYSFNGNLELEKLYFSKSSDLKFIYYKKNTNDKNNFTNMTQIPDINLKEIYKNKDKLDNYAVKILFRNIRRYTYANLLFDFKNVINLKTPRGDVQVSWKEYLKNKDSFLEFFKCELIKSGLIESFLSSNEPILQDIKTWFLDEDRLQNFNHERLLDNKFDEKIKENVLYSNNKNTSGITVSYMFLLGTEYEKISFKQGSKIEDSQKKIIKKLEDKIVYPTLKNKDNYSDFSSSEILEARKYHSFLGWYYELDYPEAGIRRGDKFDIEKNIPSNPFKTYKLSPKFERIAVDLYYMDEDDIFQSEDEYQFFGKVKKEVPLKKRADGSYEFFYKLRSYKDDNENKYFQYWVKKDNTILSDNMEFDLSKLPENKKGIYAFPKFKKYVNVEFKLLNLENLNLGYIKGKDNETVLSKASELLKIHEKIKEVAGYKQNENSFNNYYLTNGDILRDDMTFHDLLEYGLKVEIRYNKIPVTTSFISYFYNSETNYLDPNNIGDYTKFYEKDQTFRDVLNDYREMIDEKYPDSIFEPKSDSFLNKKIGEKAFKFTVNIYSPRISLKIENERYYIYKDQKINLNYFPKDKNKEVIGYKIVGKNITFKNGDNLNSLIKKQDDNKEYECLPILKTRLDGVIQIEKVFIDPSKDINDPLRVRKYLVTKKITNVPLLNTATETYIRNLGHRDITSDEINDPERFEFYDAAGLWPNYEHKETKYTYYYGLKKLNFKFQLKYKNITQDVKYYSHPIDTTLNDSILEYKIKDAINLFSQKIGKLPENSFTLNSNWHDKSVNNKLLLDDFFTSVSSLNWENGYNGGSNLVLTLEFN